MINRRLVILYMKIIASCCHVRGNSIVPLQGYEEGNDGKVKPMEECPKKSKGDQGIVTCKTVYRWSSDWYLDLLGIYSLQL
jgi:hypothetical protein